MGQARLRRQEIQELKKWGRLIHTPRYDQPVIVRVGDSVWVSTNSEFAAELTQAHALTQPEQAQRALARLALTAERSGVPERECQQWFAYQLKTYADSVLDRPAKPPIVFAQSASKKS